MPRSTQHSCTRPTSKVADQPSNTSRENKLGKEKNRIQIPSNGREKEEETKVYHMGIMLSSVTYVWFDKEQEGNKTPLVTTTDEDGVVEKGETETPFWESIMSSTCKAEVRTSKAI
jgi:hypothetical protein